MMIYELTVFTETEDRFKFLSHEDLMIFLSRAIQTRDDDLNFSISKYQPDAQELNHILSSDFIKQDRAH